MSKDSPLRPPANKAGKRISFALAIAVHLVLAGFLFYGVRWQTKSTDAVEVELVRAVPAPAPAAPIAVPPAPTPEPAPTPVPVPEPKPLPPPPKPDIAIKEKEKPKPPPKPEPVPAPARVDPFQEQLKREAEQLTQRKQVDSAAQELAQMKASQAAASRNKAMADYLGRIRGKIRGNIVVPPEVKGNPEAVFDVTQLPSGEIVTVRLKRSSGHTALDAAIERAILKSNPLPKPEPADLFSRSLELRFKPLVD
ncbi:energy transducer TonB [Sulfuritalea sp.]|uniref:energy transducer TonB n=1 Tax=Sulfuritalea sp. TaxID=2480090 RepID=UPI001ACBFD24|nr:energy transducer TonB [Sulfuritalea sp.]MBN8474013.1 TonB C-terminal domain-containing protein [Sulfuritalea sp.]